MVVLVSNVDATSGKTDKDHFPSKLAHTRSLVLVVVPVIQEESLPAAKNVSASDWNQLLSSSVSAHCTLIQSNFAFHWIKLLKANALPLSFRYAYPLTVACLAFSLLRLLFKCLCNNVSFSLIHISGLCKLK